MALGNTNNVDGKLIILTPKTKDAEGNKTKPHFVISEKVNGQWVNRNETVDRFSGNIKKVVARVKEIKKDGKVINNLNLLDLYVADGDETYLASFTFKISTRGLMNRLLSLTDPNNIQVSFWEDDRGYEVLTLRQNDEVVKGKYTKEEIPVPSEVKIRGKIERDYYEVDQFFIENINAMSFDTSKAQSKPAQSEAQVKAKKAAKVEVPSDEEDQDIPF